MSEHELYIKRCFELAKLGGKATKTNPNVGACIVFENRIIGEGYHQEYGGPHAEVNAFASVKKEDEQWLPYSTLYVSLEPCCHHGKTPPCTDLIVEKKVPEVVISCLDINPIVAGKGIKTLEEKGVKVTSGILKEEGEFVLKKFYANLEKRPYVILKWAQTADGIIGNTNSRLLITQQESNILVHKWRTEVDGIMVGSNTLKQDNPHLTARYFEGDHPCRITFDKEFLYTDRYNVMNREAKTLLLTKQEKEDIGNLSYLKVADPSDLNEVMKGLYQQRIYSILVEGGNKLLSSFIALNLWDECRIIVSKGKYEGDAIYAVKAPFFDHRYNKKIDLGGDVCYIISKS